MYHDLECVLDYLEDILFANNEGAEEIDMKLPFAICVLFTATLPAKQQCSQKLALPNLCFSF